MAFPASPQYTESVFTLLHALPVVESQIHAVALAPVKSKQGIFYLPLRWGMTLWLPLANAKWAHVRMCLFWAKVSRGRMNSTFSFPSGILLWEQHDPKLPCKKVKPTKPYWWPGAKPSWPAASQSGPCLPQTHEAKNKCLLFRHSVLVVCSNIATIAEQYTSPYHTLYHPLKISHATTSGSGSLWWLFLPLFRTMCSA